MPDLARILNSQFEVVENRSLELLARIPDERLFWRPEIVEPNGEPYSCGELIIRSAAAIERVFGGITRRLWDDPFEWTLPEELADRERIAGYLNDVQAARQIGFSFFREESDLFRQIPAPDELKPIAAVLIEALDRASHLQGRAYGVAQQFLRIRPHLP